MRTLRHILARQQQRRAQIFLVRRERGTFAAAVEVAALALGGVGVSHPSGLAMLAPQDDAETSSC